MQRRGSGSSAFANIRAHSATKKSNSDSNSLFRTLLGTLAAECVAGRAVLLSLWTRVSILPPPIPIPFFVSLFRPLLETLAAERKGKKAAMPPLQTFAPLLPPHITISIALRFSNLASNISGRMQRGSAVVLPFRTFLPILPPRIPISISFRLSRPFAHH